MEVGVGKCSPPGARMKKKTEQNNNNNKQPKLNKVKITHDQVLSWMLKQWLAYLGGVVVCRMDWTGLVAGMMLITYQAEK